MSEPQVWVLVGVFSAFVLGSLTLMSTILPRLIHAEIGRLDAKIDSTRDVLSTQIASLETRVERIDGDVTAITRHLMGDGS